MLTSRAARPASADVVLADLIESFIGRLQGGEPVDPAAFAAEHPEHAPALLALLPAAAAMADLRRSALREAAPEWPVAGLEDGAIGDYRVVREVGRGGMGVVYEAEQVSLGRRVALKVLPGAGAADPRQLARFRVEAQAAAALHHPHIVPVFAVGSERGVHYYAMQFIEGRSLAAAVAGDPSIDLGPREAARLARQAAEALEHAHGLGILHRDIKPANLLVDDSGHLWVADFGLARFLDGGALTETGDVVGTLRYLSPEQASGRRVLDPRSDVYSLGATLYELATLRPAFDGVGRQELVRQILRDEPAPPRRVDPSLPRDLETIILKAMAKEAGSRYASAWELADDLGRFLDDRPILARRPGPSAMAARWGRRHRGAVATAGALVAVLVGALAVGAGLLWREQARTRDNLRVALTALDEFCLSTSDMELPRDPERVQALQGLQLKALAIYERVLRQNPGDLEARWSAARANRRVANLLSPSSPRAAEVERAYRAAEAHLALLPGGRPSRRESADLLGDWGTFHALQHPRESTAILRRALAGHERLAEEEPADPGYRRAIARDSLELSKTIGILKPAEAEEKERLQRRAVAIRRGLRDGSFAARADLAEALGYLHHLLGATGRQEEGDRVLAEARGITASMEADFPADPTYRHKILVLEHLFAYPRYCRPPDRPEATIKACRATLAARARLVDDFPFVPEFRAGLAWSHQTLSALLLTLDRPDEAEAEARRSVDLFEALIRDHPAVEHYRRWMHVACQGLGGMMAKSGRPDDARAFLRRAAEVLPEAHPPG